MGPRAAFFVLSVLCFDYAELALRATRLQPALLSVGPLKLQGSAAVVAMWLFASSLGLVFFLAAERLHRLLMTQGRWLVICAGLSLLCHRKGGGS
jgi:hypothetical protein